MRGCLELLRLHGEDDEVGVRRSHRRDRSWRRCRACRSITRAAVSLISAMRDVVRRARRFLSRAARSTASPMNPQPISPSFTSVPSPPPTPALIPPGVRIWHGRRARASTPPRWRLRSRPSCPSTVLAGREPRARRRSSPEDGPDVLRIIDTAAQPSSARAHRCWGVGTGSARVQARTPERRRTSWPRPRRSLQRARRRAHGA